MAVHERQNSAVHRTCVKQRGSRVKPEVATVSLARGVFGGDRCTNTETEREQSNAGEFPKTLTLSASIHRYHLESMPLNSNIQLSLSLAQHFLFETLFYPFSNKYSSMTKYCKFLSFCTTLDRSNIYFFSLRI
jgi:hypothetical protein